MNPVYGSWNSGYDPEVEALRQKLMDEVYAGSFSGMPAMFSDEDKLRKANEQELREIARSYGYDA